MYCRSLSPFYIFIFIFRFDNLLVFCFYYPMPVCQYFFLIFFFLNVWALIYLPTVLQCLSVLSVTNGLPGKFCRFQKCWPESNIIQNGIISWSAIFGQFYFWYFWKHCPLLDVILELNTQELNFPITVLHRQVNSRWKTSMKTESIHYF